MKKVKVGPPLPQLSGSAHANNPTIQRQTSNSLGHIGLNPREGVLQNLKEERPKKLRVWEGDDVSFSMLKLSFNYMIQNIQSTVMEVHSISNSQIVWLTITFFKFSFVIN